MNDIQTMLWIVIILLFLNMIFIWRPWNCFNVKHRKQYNHSKNGTCNPNSCGAIDPVNDPDYNMRNIVKQSILLEEHIAEKNKYCLGCIVKHFLHIIGLAEEAVWLAGKDIEKYPMLKDAVAFYQQWFDKWHKNKQNEEIKKTVLSALRENRRKMVELYYLH